MKITILGSGSFFIDKDHSAPAYLVQTGGKNILFDCGPGTQKQLAAIDVDPLSIEYIFVTHFHNDHTSDLLSILMRAFILETFYGGTLSHSIKVIGPKGIHNFVTTLAVTQGHNDVVDFAKLEFIEFDGSIDFGSFKVESFGVEHLGMDAYALRMEAEGKIFTYTGDAIHSEGVIEAAKNTDLLITDCATPKDKPATAHLGTTQVGEICRDHGVKKVILSHQVPPGYNVDMVSQVKEIFDGEVILAKDLMVVEV